MTCSTYNMNKPVNNMRNEWHNDKEYVSYIYKENLLAGPTFLAIL